MVKRICSVFLIFIIIAGISACNSADINENNDKISVVCTTPAASDWTKEIIGDNAAKFDLLLLGHGGDLHSFQPTAEDIAKIYTADLVVQIGGTTEDWLNDLSIDDKALKLFDLLDENEKLCVGEGQQSHKHLNNEYDEHIWLSLKFAQRMTRAICERICDLDKASGVEYQRNSAEYTEKLKKLDREYQNLVNSSKDKTVIFADRYPFTYLMRDYDITCFSAFEGCSSDADASFEIIAELSEKVKEYNKDTVLILENSTEGIIEPLNLALNDINIEAAVMNSYQTLDIKYDNESYIDIMTENLNSLKKALRG